jgi:hypothetical protein
MMNCIFVLRDLFMLTIDQSESVQQISRCYRGFSDAILHRFFLLFQIERFPFLFLLVFLRLS